MANLSKNAKQIQEELLLKGLDFKVKELSASTRTAQDAASAIGCEIAQIIKSLIFCTQETHKPVLVLASGVNRVNEKAIATHIGEKIAKADADFTRDTTGYAIGGIPPIGHKSEIKTLIDQDLLKYDELWAAAGTPHAVFCLNSSSLQKLTHGEILNIT
jgi:Cys-tRNA(Pro) deacylase